MTALTTPSRDQIERQLAVAFQAAGHDLYLVGGALRDELLGVATFDLDYATSAPPDQTLAILESLDRGRPYRVGERFGTIGEMIGPFRVEITTYRGENYRAGSRKPEVKFGESLAEDLERRDFTVNAMARNTVTREMIGLLGAQQDLLGRILRAVGNPAERFREDPLRLLRGVRFASTLGFTIESDTWDATKSIASQLPTISKERIRDELNEMLISPARAQAFELLRDSGLLQYAAPTLLELTLMPDHGPRHPLSLWEHTMKAVNGVAGRVRRVEVGKVEDEQLALLWAALLHDIAKPSTRTFEPDGRPRFFHHEERGAEMAGEMLRSLRHPSRLVETAQLLVGTHMQLHAYTPTWSDGAVRRLMLRLGDHLQAALILARADAAAHALEGPGQFAHRYDQLEERIGAVSTEPKEMLRSPLTGKQLMDRYGLAPGPGVGELKDALREEVIEGRLASGDIEGAWEIADRLVGEQGRG
ncbi:MAG: CCA tRNA nucleotidyltransferase [Chloroflexota bacterium]